MMIMVITIVTVVMIYVGLLKTSTVPLLVYPLGSSND